jgi:sugar/nucleoside kinase (ribokinase family)
VSPFLFAANRCRQTRARRAARPGEGIIVFDAAGFARIRAVPVHGPIDTVGAGDSAVAGLSAALCAGASPREVAKIGNLVASVTIHQIGTTETATPGQVLAANRGARK